MSTFSIRGRTGVVIVAAVASLAAVTIATAGPRARCWMTGGGSVFTASGTSVDYAGDFDTSGRVTHGFELRCEGRPNNLEINWEGNRFHLTSLTSAICIDDAAIEPDPPDADFDTYIGTGVGRYNGDAGFCASWIFTDAGEPGVPDTATIEITDCENTVIMQVSGPLTRGNHQAHSS